MIFDENWFALLLFKSHSKNIQLHFPVGISLFFFSFSFFCFHLRNIFINILVLRPKSTFFLVLFERVKDTEIKFSKVIL